MDLPSTPIRYRSAVREGTTRPPSAADESYGVTPAVATGPPG
uniref:Uncharacterized protein n=1 Tax=Arundo donax TaxID=35708 RepID=A0A0A9ERD8_ARUDO